jgi:hypothetical protein
MSRARSTNIILNTSKKCQIIKDCNIDSEEKFETKETDLNDFTDISSNLDIISNYTLSNIITNNLNISQNNINPYVKNYIVPEFTNKAKNFRNKIDPIKFSEKAQIAFNLENNSCIIRQNKIDLDFIKFLSQFDNENELTSLEINDILNLKLEKIVGLKEKIKKIIEIAYNYKENNDESVFNEVLYKLNEIYDKILQEEKKMENVQFVINKIDKINYGENQCKIFLKNN